ncbi:MAG: hypothetical protein AM324_009560, partial [Candidatus Thorarchaeota archaeon SMTZ1-83]
MSEQKPVDTLKAIGLRITEAITEGRFPVVDLPNRGTDNIEFDAELNQFVLGESKVKRDSSNLKHIRSF